MDTLTIDAAIDFQKKGRFAEAKEIYNRFIEKNPSNHRVSYLLGLVEYKERNFNKAIQLFQHAIELSPASSEYYKDLGNCYKQLKEYDKAVVNYTKAIKINPKFSEVYYDMGIMHFQKCDYDCALSNFKTAIFYKPEFVDAYINMAMVLQKVRKYSEAVLIYTQALKFQPNNELILNNLGNLFFLLGQEDFAISTFQKIISLNPHSSKAYCNLGMIFRDKKDYQKAVACFEKTIFLDPGFEDPYLLLGNLFQIEGRYESAINWFEKSLKINVNNAFTHASIGEILFEKGHEQKALSYLKKAVKLDSEFTAGYSGLIKVMLKVCCWKDLNIYNEKLDKLSSDALRTNEKVYETPFLNLVRHSDSSLNYKIAYAHSQHIAQKIKNFGKTFCFKQRKRENKKIHIGYLSNNFRNHPTASLLQDLFSTHNRNYFNISCYSYGPDDESKQRKHIKSTCDNFVDIEKLDDAEAAKKIYKDNVDIIVDLVGYLKDNRIAISAFHPAPIQVRWLGMAGTSGSNFYEYLITDQIVTPEDEADKYSEKFIYLPDCYQINSYRSLKIEKTKKEQWGVPSDYFVFCSFNTTYKLDPFVFECWLNILKRVPKSLLWIFVESDFAKENLKSFLKENGVAPERIQFAERLPKIEHLKRLSCADLALDTFTINGAATTSDALWARVPVLTVKGNHFASRMSASILSAIGLSDLIFENIKDYQNKAIELAQNSIALQNVKSKLTHQIATAPLFDTNRSVKLLEKAYMMSWDLYEQGKPPQLLRVKE